MESQELCERESKLEDSEMTPVTETGSVSEEEGAGWFTGISSDFRTLASSIRETAGGVADFVHRSAVAVATEIANLEEIESQESAEEGEVAQDKRLPLPWLVTGDDGLPQEDLELKRAILELGEKDDTFLEPLSTDSADQNEFVLDEPRINLIRQLLEVDGGLASTHARLSGRSDVREAVFWSNYFARCDLAREKYLQEKQAMLHGSMDSLVRAGSEDDASFVNVPSPPQSLGMMSIGSSCVVVDGDLPTP